MDPWSGHSIQRYPFGSPCRLIISTNLTTCTQRGIVDMAGEPRSDSRLAQWRRLLIAKTGHPDLAAAEERTSSAGLRHGHLAGGSRNGRHRGLLQPAALQLRHRSEKEPRIR